MMVLSVVGFGLEVSDRLVLLMDHDSKRILFEDKESMLLHYFAAGSRSGLLTPSSMGRTVASIRLRCLCRTAVTRQQHA